MVWPKMCLRGEVEKKIFVFEGLCTGFIHQLIPGYGDLRSGLQRFCLPSVYPWRGATGRCIPSRSPPTGIRESQEYTKEAQLISRLTMKHLLSNIFRVFCLLFATEKRLHVIIEAPNWYASKYTSNYVYLLRLSKIQSDLNDLWATFLAFYMWTRSPLSRTASIFNVSKAKIKDHGIYLQVRPDDLEGFLWDEWWAYGFHGSLIGARVWHTDFPPGHGFLIGAQVLCTGFDPFAGQTSRVLIGARVYHTGQEISSSFPWLLIACWTTNSMIMMRTNRRI